MKQRIIDDNHTSRYVNLKAAANYMGLGTQTTKKVAVKIGAEKRVGKRCIYDLQKIDEYFTENDSVNLLAMAAKGIEA